MENKVENQDSIALDLNMLDDVTGGIRDVSAATMAPKIKARCKRCGKHVQPLAPERDGGNKGVFMCINRGCDEYGKKKYTDEVKWS